MANNGDSIKYFIFFEPHMDHMTKVVVITEEEFVKLEKFRDKLKSGIVPSSVGTMIWDDDNGIYNRDPLIDDGNSIVLSLV